MAVKIFGTLTFDKIVSKWCMDAVPPHVCIKLKSVFPRIPKAETCPFWFGDTEEIAADLVWFTDRYPMRMSDQDALKLVSGRRDFNAIASRMEGIMAPGYTPGPVALKEGFTARPYQLQGADLIHESKRMILGDALGLGKTLTGILSLLKPGALPAIVVVQTHLTVQWKEEIQRFTNLSVHIIKGTQPYSLPKADVYIIKYSCLTGWVDTWTTFALRTVIFDEVQELRHPTSLKYSAAKALAATVDFALGMSATPVYNFGNEIFHILNLLRPACLGPYDDFTREWCDWYGIGKYKVKDPAALGAYLRDSYLFLRRTTTDVGRQLPPINRIVHTVGYDHKEADRIEDLAHTLALKIMGGSFIERGSAARELDILVRQATGVAKAREVADLVRILVEGGEPVVLAGWHREVYEIWLDALSDLKPVMYTGSESEKQKRDAKEAFQTGATDLFIISLRSGVGLDGLQHRCRTVVVGELDWSPQVHEQLIGRVDRDGQTNQVTALFPVCDYGSDPVIIDLLGLKSSQAHGIANPFSSPTPTTTHDTRLKKLAERFLNKGRQN